MNDDELDEFEVRLAAAQWELEDDRDLVEAYGRQRPDAWTGIRFEGEKLVAFFSHDIEGHRLRLSRLVSHPDRLEVRRAAMTRRALEELAQEVGQLLHERKEREGWPCCGHGIVADRVRLLLPPGQDGLVDELRGRYGDSIHIDVGLVVEQ